MTYDTSAGQTQKTQKSCPYCQLSILQYSGAHNNAQEYSLVSSRPQYYLQFHFSTIINSNFASRIYLLPFTKQIITMATKFSDFGKGAKGL